MRYALDAARMRAAEEAAVADGGVTIAGLMDRAGSALADEVRRRWPEGGVVVVCGPGNNGGDGWAAARLLHGERRAVAVLALGDPAALAGEAAAAARAAIDAGVAWQPAAPGASEHVFDGASVVIDAVFGFGFRGPVREPYASVLDAIAASGVPVISADVPSGVDSDTGQTDIRAVRATVTVTFSALKPGLLIQPGAACAGEIVVTHLGVKPGLLAPPGALELPDPQDLAPLLPLPRATDHKGSRGRVAVVAGSRAYSGAAVFAVRGALRMGAGYVYALVPGSIAEVLRVAAPGAIVRELPSAEDGSLSAGADVLAAVADADAVVVGPGLTTGPGAASTVRALISGYAGPIVLDADALNVCASDDAALASRIAPTLLTPHPGELARLLGIRTDDVQADRVASAGAMAGAGRVCMLKGPGTIVAGEARRAMVTAGNAGLARAGTGDVLAGMLGTLLAQGVDTFDAAVLGAHLHGRAGDAGAAVLTQTCLTAADLDTFLPEAVRELLGG